MTNDNFYLAGAVRSQRGRKPIFFPERVLCARHERGAEITFAIFIYFLSASQKKGTQNQKKKPRARFMKYFYKSKNIAPDSH
jgi:hypothetical protein